MPAPRPLPSDTVPSLATASDNDDAPSTALRTSPSNASLFGLPVFAPPPDTAPVQQPASWGTSDEIYSLLNSFANSGAYANDDPSTTTTAFDPSPTTPAGTSRPALDRLDLQGYEQQHEPVHGAYEAAEEYWHDFQHQAPPLLSFPPPPPPTGLAPGLPPLTLPQYGLLVQQPPLPWPRITARPGTFAPPPYPPPGWPTRGTPPSADDLAAYSNAQPPLGTGFALPAHGPPVGAAVVHRPPARVPRFPDGMTPSVATPRGVQGGGVVRRTRRARASRADPYALAALAMPGPSQATAGPGPSSLASLQGMQAATYAPPTVPVAAGTGAPGPFVQVTNNTIAGGQSQLPPVQAQGLEYRGAAECTLLWDDDGRMPIYDGPRMFHYERTKRYFVCHPPAEGKTSYCVDCHVPGKTVYWVDARGLKNHKRREHGKEPRGVSAKYHGRK